MTSPKVGTPGTVPKERYLSLTVARLLFSAAAILAAEFFWHLDIG
jgi:hypothetical protein